MDVNSIGPLNGGQPVQRSTNASAPQPSESRPVSPKDELDITSVDSAANAAELDSAFRAERIAQIQQEIADGTYETTERLEAAVDRMLDSLLAEE